VELAPRIEFSAVSTDLSVSTRDEVLRWAAEQLAEAGAVTDGAEAFDRLVERERIMSTAIAPGVAVPHARSGGAAKVAVSMIRLAGPVDFGARDGAPVELVVTVIGPPEATIEHVRVLGQVAKLIQDPGARAAVLEAATPRQLVDAVQCWEERQGGGAATP
jgi:mannitol/fructose-specific phosphotransferase system IIA component (Ntr-type)